MLTIIVKGTNGCNFDCSYCSLGKKTNTSISGKEMLIDIMRYSCKLALSRKEGRILFILHGGEPTLIAPKAYSLAIEAINIEYPDITKEFSIQTNGWVISDEFIEFYKKYDITVGVSIDGSKTIQDEVRRSASGKPTYDVVCSNIDRLLKNDIRVSCLMVLSSGGLKEDYSYLDFFYERNIHLKINPLLNYGEVYEHPELSIAPGDYSKYMIGLYEYILDKSINISVSPIDKILQAVLGDGKIRECSFNPKCNESFLCIDYLGDIYPCGKYSDMHLFKLGNIYEENFKLLHSEELSLLISRRTKSIPQKCKECSYISMCNAGCNAEASIDGRFNDAPLMCEDYRRLFEYFHSYGLTLLKHKLLLRRKELIEVGVRTTAD